MAGVPLVESGGAAARSMALAGRQVFDALLDEDIGKMVGDIAKKKHVEEKDVEEFLEEY